MAAGEAVQAQDRQTSEAPQRRSAGIMPMVVPLVLGLVVGAAASWALLFGTLDRATLFVDGFLSSRWQSLSQRRISGEER